MPSFKEITGTIVTVIILLNCTGHGELVWKGIALMRHHAMAEVHKPWGCPSVFSRNACHDWRRK